VRDWATVNWTGGDQLEAARLARLLREHGFLSKAMYDLRREEWGACVSPPDKLTIAREVIDTFGKRSAT
jgi:hypothetical protein